MTTGPGHESRRRAVERGVLPFPNVPPGYRRTVVGERSDGRVIHGPLEPDPVTAAVVAEAFRRRAEGATVMETREYLRQHGVERSFHGTQALLGSRIVLGELRFGDMLNPSAHPAIIDVETWVRVQRMRSPRGRRPKSERLLARLGVLRCGTCGARMVTGSTDQNGKRHYMYRCPPVGDCTRRVTVSADLVEAAVVERVRDLLEGVSGSAGVLGSVTDAERELERTDCELEAAVQAFSGLEDVAAARERLLGLRDARDRARERVDELRAAVEPSVVVTAGDWDDLSLEGRRAVIRAVVASVVVAPGRGRDRITIEARGK